MGYIGLYRSDPALGQRFFSRIHHRNIVAFISVDTDEINEYIKYDGLGLAELIRNREVSATEVTDCARQAIDSVNPQINSIIEQFPAPLSANQSPDAPFQGVPFLIKDLALHAKGVLNEFGSRLAQGIRFNHDTELMKRFRNAGLQTLGRTATPEFGYCATTEP